MTLYEVRRKGFVLAGKRYNVGDKIHEDALSLRNQKVMMNLGWIARVERKRGEEDDDASIPGAPENIEPTGNEVPQQRRKHRTRDSV